MTRRGLPRSLRDLATLARTYDQEAHAPLLSVAVQRLLLAPLVWLASRREQRLESLGHTAGARVTRLGTLDAQRQLPLPAVRQ